jgi:hypothetical protein
VPGAAAEREEVVIAERLARAVCLVCGAPACQAHTARCGVCGVTGVRSGTPSHRLARCSAHALLACHDCGGVLFGDDRTVRRARREMLVHGRECCARCGASQCPQCHAMPPATSVHVCRL